MATAGTQHKLLIFVQIIVTRPELEKYIFITQLLLVPYIRVSILLNDIKMAGENYCQSVKYYVLRLSDNVTNICPLNSFSISI